jgi:site-specific DNA-methyltransferase (adenine-specific)
MSDFYINTYNPDVLSCLANLSNDEVFTPPDIVNKMLDMLPQQLFSDKTVTFLDPAVKSGVFLREIAKRLLVGLENEIPDLQERIDHIFHKQLFGIAITEMTSLLARRSVYCSKWPNGPYSITKFDDAEGNIRFKKIKHVWRGEKCAFCGAAKSEYDRDEALETHAYEFIHTTKPEEIFNMKFDVIIGNPPYQLEIGVEKDNYSIPIYHKFVNQAKKLNPRYMTMIIPARWYAGGRGLDEFRSEMLNDKCIREIVDYFDPSECFPGIDLSGGVCYFKWDRDNVGQCKITQVLDGKSTTVIRPLLEDNEETFIRFNSAISIYAKIKAIREDSFSNLVSPQTPFGFVSSFNDYMEKPFQTCVKLHTVKGVKYISREQVKKNAEWVEPNKVYISKSYGERGSFPYLFLAKPFVGDENSCCTQTYLMIGPTKSRDESENIRTYIQTKFFRFLIMLRKNTQDAMRGVYSFVPIQDFSEFWNDEKLYIKYGLTEEEIAFIENMVRPMELGENDDNNR